MSSLCSSDVAAAVAGDAFHPANRLGLTAAQVFPIHAFAFSGAVFIAIFGVDIHYQTSQYHR
jgi:hypothetical protein